MKKVLIVAFLLLVTVQPSITNNKSIMAQEREPQSPTMPAEYHALVTEKALSLMDPDIQKQIRKYERGDRPAVVDGSVEEDFPWWNFPYLHHSWNPDNNDYWVKVEWVDRKDQSGTALDWADIYFREAIRIYQSDKEEAYHKLGRVAHLLGDVATPAHVPLDAHYPPFNKDHYEIYLDDLLSDGDPLNDLPRAEYSLKDYRALRASIPSELDNQVDNYNTTGNTHDTAEELWAYGPVSYSSDFHDSSSLHRVDYDLYHIFHEMAEHADDYSTRDADGELNNPRPTGSNDPILVGDRLKLVPDNVAKIASLLQLFWDRTHASTNVDVMLIIDSSGSMSGNDPYGKRRDAAKNYLTTSVAGDFVGVVDFDSDAHLASSLQALPENRDALEIAINSIDSSGGTNIAAGVQMACDELKRSTSGNSTKAAILLTDGKGTFNSEDSCFAEQNWSIYTFALGSADDDLLRQIAINTGGEFSRLDTSRLLCEFQAIRTKIGNGTPTSCNSFDLLPQQREVFYASVSPGQIQQTFSTSWAGSDFVMTLNTPSGRVINRSTVADDVFHDLGPTYESYRISNPEPGDWQIELFAADVPAEGEEVVFSRSSIPLPLDTPGSIGISVATEPDANVEFEFEGDLGFFTISSGSDYVVEELLSGNYLITQNPSDGWSLTKVDCADADIELTENGVTVRLRPGEEVLCTFVNQNLAPEPGNVFFPVIVRPVNPSHVAKENDLVGTVTASEKPVEGLSILLNRSDSTGVSNIASTVTDSMGHYSFEKVPLPQDSSSLAVRWNNDANIDDWLSTWACWEITASTTNPDAYRCDFDIANIELLTPDHNATLSLPAAFSWEKRALTTDEYEFNIADMHDYDPHWWTDPALGYVAQYSLSGLPPGFSTGDKYGWWPWVNGPDGYGLPYYYRFVTFAGTSGPFAAETTMQPFSSLKSNAELLAPPRPQPARN